MICLIFTWDILGYVWDIPETKLKYARYMPDISLRYALDTSVILCYAWERDGSGGDMMGIEYLYGIFEKCWKSDF